MTMKAKKHRDDKLTPMERRRAIDAGQAVDRCPAVPFMSEFKCRFAGISVWEFWHDPVKMAEAEILPFNRYGYDRMVIGPNTRGITEALGGEYVYPENGVPYSKGVFLQDYSQLGEMVPVEASIGGPFTIAANLRGVERLLRDCRKYPREVHSLIRIVTDSQKSCIDLASQYGLGIAMADPVANPALIGPKMYEEFVFPYTKELTDYAVQKAGRKVSLHMCGKTESIWKYIARYELNEISLDNVIDLDRAALELGGYVPIAGNVDPVEIILNGTEEDIRREVAQCITSGEKSAKGFTLATGCDIPETTDPAQIDTFMAAVREYRKNQ